MSAVSAPGRATAAYPDARILLVDDEPFHLSYLERLLRAAGYANLWLESDPRNVEGPHRTHDEEGMILLRQGTHPSKGMIARLKELAAATKPDQVVLIGERVE